jgi:hypothetical protein
MRRASTAYISIGDVFIEACFDVLLAASQLLTDVGEEGDVLRPPISKQRRQFPHSPLRPLGVKTSQYLVFILESLRTVPHLSRSRAPDDAFAVPVQNVVQTANVVVTELTPFVERVVVGPTLRHIDIQTIIGS